MSIIRDFVELVRNLTANLNLKVDKNSITSGNNGNTVVSRDVNGNFSAGTITAALNGTAANANKLIGANWNWSGQRGQPIWLWGGTDGVNMYVYNPSNFSVNYATTADNLTTPSGGYKHVGAWGVDSITATGAILVNSAFRADHAYTAGNANYANSAGVANSISAAVVGTATAGISAGAVGSYSFLSLIDGFAAPGITIAGSYLRYSNAGANDVETPSPSGTWRCMADATSGQLQGFTTLFLRIA